MAKGTIKAKNTMTSVESGGKGQLGLNSLTQIANAALIAIQPVNMLRPTRI